MYLMTKAFFNILHPEALVKAIIYFPLSFPFLSPFLLPLQIPNPQYALPPFLLRLDLVIIVISTSCLSCPAPVCQCSSVPAMPVVVTGGGDCNTGEFHIRLVTKLTDPPPATSYIRVSSHCLAQARHSYNKLSIF